MSTAQVIVGVSGGVDSSVAALLLRDAGHPIAGLFMQNWADDGSGECRAEEDRRNTGLGEPGDIARRRVANGQRAAVLVALNSVFQVVAFGALAWVLTRETTTIAGGFGYGFIFGAVFYLPLLPWISGLVGVVPWIALSLVEALSLRGQVNHPAGLIFDMLNSSGQYIHFHDHPYTAAIRVVIHLLVFVQSKVPNIDGIDLQYPVLSGAADHAGLQRRGKHLREKC